MTTWLVTRHTATVQWVKTMARHKRLPFSIDRVIEHLDVRRLAPGDTVVGTLPLSLAAALHERGMAFWSLDIDIPQSERAKELSALQLACFGARLTRYEVRESKHRTVVP